MIQRRRRIEGSAPVRRYRESVEGAAMDGEVPRRVAATRAGAWEGGAVRELPTDLPLAGVVLTDARTGAPVDLGRLGGVRVLTLIRHRF